MDLRNKTIRLRIDDLDDLWTIYNIIQPDDLALAKSFRREKQDLQDSRPERGEKKPVYLGIRVEKVDFHPYVNAVRLTGRIERGIDVGSYHTLNVEPGSVISLVREWRGSEVGSLKEAVKLGRRPMILVVAVEEGEASFAVIRQRGVDFVNEVSVNIPGKREKSHREAARAKFYSAVAQSISEIASSRGLSQVLIVGPELVRAGFKAYLDENSRLLNEFSVSYDTCYSPGRTGIYEAMRRGAVDRIVTSNRVTTELNAIEELLGRIAKERPAAYGLEEVRRAVKTGAVETLLVTDEIFRNRRRDVDLLMKEVEGFSGEHLMISTDHEGGVKLRGLGGIGAILRYAIPQ